MRQKPSGNSPRQGCAADCPAADSAVFRGKTIGGDLSLWNTSDIAKKTQRNNSGGTAKKQRHISCGTARFWS
jgi:hypothetical protein